MTKLIIEHTCQKNDAELMSWMENELQKIVSEKIRFENVVVTVNQAAKSANFSGKTVKGFMQINLGNIKMEIDLPFLYRPFIPAIRTAISNIINEL